MRKINEQTNLLAEFQDIRSGFFNKDILVNETSGKENRMVCGTKIIR